MSSLFFSFYLYNFVKLPISYCFPRLSRSLYKIHLVVFASLVIHRVILSSQVLHPWLLCLSQTKSTFTVVHSSSASYFFTYNIAQVVPWLTSIEGEGYLNALLHGSITYWFLNLNNHPLLPRNEVDPRSLEDSNAFFYINRSYNGFPVAC
jgi:hypothetical protein